MLSKDELNTLWEKAKEVIPDKFNKLTQLNRSDISNMMFEVFKQEEIEKSDWDGVSYCQEMMYFEGLFGVEEFNEIVNYVNSQNPVYCVYIWFIKTDDGNIPFYVGRGKKYRAKNRRNRSEKFLEIIDKFDCDFVVIKEQLSEYQALILENELINDFRNKDVNLVNKTKPRPNYQIF